MRGRSCWRLLARSLPCAQFYKHGCWQRVVIDNFLPCLEGEDQLAYAYR